MLLNILNTSMCTLFPYPCHMAPPVGKEEQLVNRKEAGRDSEQRNNNTKSYFSSVDSIKEVISTQLFLVLLV